MKNILLTLLAIFSIVSTNYAQCDLEILNYDMETLEVTIAVNNGFGCNPNDLTDDVIDSFILSVTSQNLQQDEFACGLPGSFNYPGFVLQNYFPNNFEYFNIYIPDNNNCSIYHSFDNVLNFFHSQVNNNKKVFFIHCYYGASRSAILVLLLLIKYYNLSFDNAKLLLEEKRKIVNINTTFLKELELYLQPEF